MAWPGLVARRSSSADSTVPVERAGACQDKPVGPALLNVIRYRDRNHEIELLSWNETTISVCRQLSDWWELTTLEIFWDFRNVHSAGYGGSLVGIVLFELGDLNC